MSRLTQQWRASQELPQGLSKRSFMHAKEQSERAVRDDRCGCAEELYSSLPDGAVHELEQS